MTGSDYDNLFTRGALNRLFPKDRADKFFDALYGDAAEGAYDIRLEYKGSRDSRLSFEFLLAQRPGKCLACNLTYGLPTVFTRHPVINVKGMVTEIEKLLAGKAKVREWRLGRTREISRELHVIPLELTLA